MRTDLNPIESVQRAEPSIKSNQLCKQAVALTNLHLALKCDLYLDKEKHVNAGVNALGTHCDQSEIRSARSARPHLQVKRLAL